MVNTIGSSMDRIFIPVSTEHYAYNLFEVTSNAKDCWANSYILMSFVPNDIAQTKKLIGHYPKIYTQTNIPIFGLYDFALLGTKIYVTFNADPKIYLLDFNGNPIHSFGCADDDIKLNYPQTKTFNEYDDKWDEHRDSYGYYDRLYVDEDFVLRTCRTDSGGYKLQVYREEEMVGDIAFDRKIKIIGRDFQKNYYAFVRDDFDEEKFVLIRFKLSL